MNHDTTFPGHTQAAISVTAPGMPSKAPRFDMYLSLIHISEPTRPY